MRDNEKGATPAAQRVNVRSSNGGAGGPSELPTRDLLRRIVADIGDLMRKEIDLAKAELRANIHSGVAMAKGMLAAAALTLVGLTLLLVSAAMGLALIMPAWAAALVVAGALLAGAALAFALGWNRRVRRPLDRTRRHIKEDVRWAKNRFS